MLKILPEVWNRFEPIEFPDYSLEEMIKIVGQIGQQHFAHEFRSLGAEAIEQAAWRVVNRLRATDRQIKAGEGGLTLRDLLNATEKELLVEKVPFLKGVFLNHLKGIREKAQNGLLN